MSKKIYGLKQFYRHFLNLKIYRDYRHEPLTRLGVMSAVKDNEYLLRHDPNADYKNSFLNWVLKRQTDPSKVYYELTHFKDIGDFRNYNKANRLCDRLLFDFDNSTPVLKELKDSAKYIVKSNKDVPLKKLENKLKPLQRKYKDIVLNTDVLEQSYNDCKELVNYFNRSNIPIYTEFSGGKGFHAYVFFDDIPNTTVNVGHDESVLKNTVYKFGNDLINKLNLATFDPAPFNDILAGLGRVPYSKHEFSTLYVLPCDMSEPLDSILDRASKRKVRPEPFNFNDYCSGEFRSFLLNLCNVEKTRLKTSKLIAQNININNKHLNKEGAKEFKADVNNPFTDMRVLCRFILPKDLFQSHHSNYDLYWCPFHDYDHASVFVTKGRFNCQSATCTSEVIKEFGGNGKLKPSEFIKKYYKLKTIEEVNQKKAEIKRAYLKVLKEQQHK